MRFFVHDADILRLTARHNVNHDEIYELGSIAGDMGKARERALADAVGAQSSSIGGSSCTTF